MQIGNYYIKVEVKDAKYTFNVITEIALLAFSVICLYLGLVTLLTLFQPIQIAGYVSPDVERASELLSTAYCLAIAALYRPRPAASAATSVPALSDDDPLPGQEDVPGSAYMEHG